MLRIAIALLLLAACGGRDPFPCNAVISGTGTAADGRYKCSVPPSGVYTAATQIGSIQGFASAPNGLLFTFNVTMSGPPVEMTCTDETLPTGGAFTAALNSHDGSLWQGESSFALTVTSLNTKSTTLNSQLWGNLAGNLTATLKPVQGNPATTNATVTMSF